MAVTHDGITKEHYTVSLSEAGIYIRKRNPFDIGTEVEIALPLKDGETINLKGTVIYVRCLRGDVFKIAPGGHGDRIQRANQ